MSLFTDFDIDPRLIKALADHSITTPTLVQESSIPCFLKGDNFISLASTGSGKTIAFLAPLIHKILQVQKKTRLAKALILVPTRELGMQAFKNFKLLAAHTDLTSALVIGGDGFIEQSRVLRRGADVIIATPGRFLDMWDQGRLLLSHIRYLVLDEADRMTDMGFYPDLRRIVSLLQMPLHYSLFSATMPEPVTELINSFVYKPTIFKINNPKQSADTIKQFLAKVDIPKPILRKNPNYEGFVKRELLRYLLRQENPESAIIFCNRKRDISTLYNSFIRHNFSCIALHGDMSQSERFKSLEAFTAGKNKILIASDVAARGLDIPNVSHVFNFDVPLSTDDYIHRIGRTGRAGKSGRAFTLTLCEDEYNKLSNSVKKSIEPANLDTFIVPDPKNINSSRGPKNNRSKYNEKRDNTQNLPKNNHNKAQDTKQIQEPKKIPATSFLKEKNIQLDEPSVQGFGENIPAFLLPELIKK